VRHLGDQSGDGNSVHPRNIYRAGAPLRGCVEFLVVTSTGETAMQATCATWFADEANVGVALRELLDVGDPIQSTHIRLVPKNGAIR
jgi:hypothetical protein